MTIEREPVYSDRTAAFLTAMPGTAYGAMRQVSTRVLLFTGKGGVGKTTLSAATAARSAARGRRTLILSADPAHSLGDVLGETRALTNARQIAPRLFAQEIAVGAELERHWGAVAAFLERFFAAQGVDPLRAAEMAALPGMEEAVALLALESAAASGDWDLVVLDCAPTGATVRLLALPDASRWYMERLFPLQRRVISGLAPVIERASGVPMPREGVFDALSSLHARFAAAGTRLCDAARTSVRLVATPERLAVRETQRAWCQLNLFGLSTDAVLLNKVLPGEGRTGFHARWGKAQDEHAAELARAFWFVPVKPVPLGISEVEGPAALAALGEAIYGAADPAKALGGRRAMRITNAGERAWELSLPMPPGAARRVPAVFSDGESLLIGEGKARRSLALPRTLAALVPASARIVGTDRLVVRFEPAVAPARKRGAA